MYDAIIVGARCAGAPTAMLLARRGYRVLLVDRATFPSDRPHGHFIHRQGPRRLQRWGLLERIVASGAPPVTTYTGDLGDLALVGTDLQVDGVAWGYAPRRKVLDALLVQAAVEAGAEFREHYVVEGFLTEGGRVTGIRGRDGRGGVAGTESARFTVGADGRNSRLARTVQAPVYEAVPTLLCYFFSYWSGVPHTGMELYVRGRNILFGFPTNDGLFGLFIAWPIEAFPRVRADVEGHFRSALAQVPDLAERVLGGRREERFQGTADLPNFFRRPYGPGWALVGDAGHHKDPYLALGMSDALRDAELLSQALDAALAGRCPEEEALADYERQRNAEARPEYQRNLHLARFQPPPPEVMRLRAAVQGRPEDARAFVMATMGMIPQEAFFSPDNLQRLLGRPA